ncbi:hypothetical protein GUJ93_ZPchr0009g2479 [Zizania palustris]|uniref:Cytochrome c oxidase subunit 5C n=1 Tax=Zizania palustris TaxID=103762 RepID=A0A8J5RL60_ZIZPA|nr:hypothetical protein GUJ93_ZPchr0009g2479 [Zizania palustris]
MLRRGLGPPANSSLLKGVSAKTPSASQNRRLLLSRWRRRRRRRRPSSSGGKASGLNRKKMAGGRIAHATLKGPSVVKEICIGLTLGLVAGGLWKMHHWNEQRKTRSFYDMLEKGQISVVVEE